jgi:uncharacterized surface protein with fasciclin (FAS1) repeats
MNRKMQVQPARARARAWPVAAAVAVLFATFPATAGNIVEELKREGRFTTLLAAIDAAGLTATAAGCANCTVFAPNDHAFARLPAPIVAALLKPRNRGKLAAILTYHVVGTPIPSTAVPIEPTLVQTLNASEAKIQAVREGGHVRINGVRVLEADIQANGSVVHELGDVLWPGELR